MQMRQESDERERQEKAEAEEKALRAQRQAEWVHTGHDIHIVSILLYWYVHYMQEYHLSLVKKEEQEMLETQSMPLRNYLMQHVMPTLTEGLIEVCKVKPEDAIDYLVSSL